MPQIFWNPSTASYVNRSGKPVSYTQIRASVESVADDTASRLRNLTQSFIDGKKTLPAWATESEQLIRKSLISSGQVAAGGKGQLTNSLNGRLGSLVKFHLNKFRSMSLAYERGEVSDAQLLARAEMYANATGNVFEQMRHAVMVHAGYTEARNIPGASEKPCSECPEITARGWMPIGQYKPPGTRKCKGNDKCGSDFR